MMARGFARQWMNIEAIMISSINSLVVWPNTLDIMSMMSQPRSENMVYMYGGESFGMYCYSLLKVWYNRESLIEVSVGYLFSKSPTERGVRLWFGCNCSILLMDSAVMLNNIELSGILIALWLGS